ncbi:alpha-ketoglutarate-dependent dioxygenase AlkB [Streptomyces sp. A3M-1-3]|uniref:alpha-ketoglutarate-dependent dioxygenase AlkB n=1 Tax=Streptomyces sp. A3M-1-3 TaxID=2962044 RepID=UPI0020B8737F|nr:alpha-ketoglutarate-dependent dioxygenase AlkB [Streptomyces sp. A3M-1-3]MCP3822418.1 alpha-ketoglutarate-dependent dioxygenase AlkB [Streptomyces sp. A3M-1-3]
MTVHFQASLLDAQEEIALRPLTSVRRRVLSHGAWLDLLPGWVSGADALFEWLAAHVPWHAEQRTMYEQVVAVPRLLAYYGEDDPLPHPVLEQARSALSRYYAAELGEPFRTAGLCHYRDGRDSVAWHGDTHGRGGKEDTMVAIVSVGEPRALALRPRQGGGPVIRQPVGHGDLLVMGGSCQRTWEHAILKTGKPVGPRISIQFRPRGVS